MIGSNRAGNIDAALFGLLYIFQTFCGGYTCKMQFAVGIAGQFNVPGNNQFLCHRWLTGQSQLGRYDTFIYQATAANTFIIRNLDDNTIKCFDVL